MRCAHVGANFSRGLGRRLHRGFGVVWAAAGRRDWIRGFVILYVQACTSSRLWKCFLEICLL